MSWSAADLRARSVSLCIHSLLRLMVITGGTMAGEEDILVDIRVGQMSKVQPPQPTAHLPTNTTARTAVVTPCLCSNRAGKSFRICRRGCKWSNCHCDCRSRSRVVYHRALLPIGSRRRKARYESSDTVDLHSVGIQFGVFPGIPGAL